MGVKAHGVHSRFNINDLWKGGPIIVPDGEDKVNFGPPGNIGWRAGTTTLCLSHAVRD